MHVFLVVEGCRQDLTDPHASRARCCTGRSAEVVASALAPADSLTRKNTDVHVDAARARFLQRKAARPAGKRR